jgi:hypothetical protein
MAIPNDPAKLVDMYVNICGELDHERVGKACTKTDI